MGEIIKRLMADIWGNRYKASVLMVRITDREIKVEVGIQNKRHIVEM